MNENPKLDGILVHLPLPKHIDTTIVLEAINPLKMWMVLSLQCRKNGFKS